MTCREIGTNLIALLGQDYPDPAVASHAQRCNNCSHKVESWRKILALLDIWKAPPPSSRFLPQLLDRIQNE